MDGVLLLPVLLNVIEAEGEDFEKDVDEDFLPIGVLVVVCHKSKNAKN